MKYVYIETYGCSANQNNSEIVRGLLKGAGYELTNNFDIADIVIINSCIVKSKTENKIKRRVQDLKGCRKLVIVGGCMPETDAKELINLNPEVLLLGVKHFKDIVKLIRDFYEGNWGWEKQEKYLERGDEIKVGLPKISQNKLISITQISEGCLGNCSYCKTKLAKGELVSFDMDKIVKSVESDLQQGAKEVWITSQDCVSYGFDKYGSSKLPELLQRILELKHRFKLRLGMMNPDGLKLILNKMIDVFKDKKMYKFLHIPVQSGSDKVLKDMNRKYDVKIVKMIVEMFRKEFPNITIATDIIVGYPSETDNDFKDSLELVKYLKPDVFNLSKFSKHKGTKAWNLKELSGDVISKRASELMNCHRNIALENKKKFIGLKIKVFVNNSLGNGLFEARDENYNIVLINGKDLLGKTVEVVVKNVGVHHLMGGIE